MANEMNGVEMQMYSMEAEDGSNITIRERRPFDDIADIVWTVDFAMLLLALVVGIVWFTYLAYYNSRVIGFILTKVANCLYHPNGGGTQISIGSLSISLLSGKLMLGDVVYYNRDYTLRIQYAFVIFRFWRPCTGKQQRRRLGVDDFTKAEPRVTVEISGLELHVYNRVQRYRDLDKLFNLGIFEFQSGSSSSADFIRDDDGSNRRLLSPSDEDAANIANNAGPVMSATEVRKRREWWSLWLTLIPRVDVSILVARLSFGNRLLPSTLVVSFENARSRYSVKPPTSALDEFLHVVQGSCENFKASLIKSTDYVGKYERPPRTMGDGFVVLQTSQLDFYYYQEEAGVYNDHHPDFVAGVPSSSSSPPPSWGSDLKLGKGTVLSYGPWADAQRDKLYRFFFPPDFQCAPSFPTSQQPQQQRNPGGGGGVRRAFTQFDLRISSLHDATIDLWFIPNDDVPQAIHINFTQGSYCDLTVPMVFEENGYLLL